MSYILFTDPGHPAVPCLTQKLREAGHTVRMIDGDITTLEGIRAAVREYGTPDHLIVSGCYGKKGTLLTKDTEDTVRDTDRLIMSAFSACRHFGALMTQKAAGSILFLSSTSALKPNGADLAYSLSQGALLMLQKELTQYYGPLGLRVNSVLLSPLECEAEHFDSAYLSTHYATPTKSALRRYITEEEAARACLFLLSDAASGITGETLRVDAGLEGRYFDRVPEPIREEELL